MNLSHLDNDVEYEISVYPEDPHSVRGNVLASGDEEADREAEQAVLRALGNGNQWAWCTVKVEARLPGLAALKGTAYQWYCSYGSESAFKRCTDYADMKDEAREDLYRTIELVHERTQLGADERE